MTDPMRSFSSWKITWACTLRSQWESNSTYPERFGTILMDKENMPMILTSADSTVKSTVVEAAKRDAFWDLTEYLKDEEAYPNLSQMTDEVKDALTVDGKVIGLPRQRPVGTLRRKLPC